MMCRGDQAFGDRVEPFGLHVIPPGRCAPNPGCWAAAQRREWCASPILRLSAVDATLHRTRSDVNPIVSTGTAGATHAWCPAEMTPCIGPRGCPGAVSIAVCRQSQPAVRAPLSCPAAGRDERRAIRAEVRPGSPPGWSGRSSARREDASRAGSASLSCTLSRFQKWAEATTGSIAILCRQIERGASARFQRP